MDAPLDVLYEDNHLLIVNKPAGLATMGVAEDVPSVLQLARKYIKHKYDKPGNVYLGIVSRLDAPVSGILVLARTSKAAARLTEQYRTGAVEKYYWALLDRPIEPATGDLTDWVRKDERHRRMHIASPKTPGAKKARLSYRCLESSGNVTLVEVRLHTGRKHQIRIQLSHHGYPILGDRKYNSRVSFSEGIGLHGRRVLLDHPTRKQRLEFVAPLPACWHPFRLKSGKNG